MLLTFIKILIATPLIILWTLLVLLAPFAIIAGLGFLFFQANQEIRLFMLFTTGIASLFWLFIWISIKGVTRKLETIEFVLQDKFQIVCNRLDEIRRENEIEQYMRDPFPLYPDADLPKFNEIKGN